MRVASWAIGLGRIVGKIMVRCGTPAGNAARVEFHRPEPEIPQRPRTDQMAGRPGFLGGPRGDQSDRAANSGFGLPPGFDPVWGTLGAPTAGGSNDWFSRPTEDEPEGLAVDVEIYGNGFQISGQIHTGQFDRLSDWINMQAGFVQVRDAWHVHLGQRNLPDPERHRGILWVRLDQIILVAERAAVQLSRAGAPVVDKQRRKVSIVTPGYGLRGNLHVHTHGSMKQYLESPDVHFLPLTELNVRSLSDASLVARYPFAMVNRAQLVTMLDESNSPAGDTANAEGEQSEGDMPLHRKSGAA